MDQHQAWHCHLQAFRTEHSTTYEGKILRKFKVEGKIFKKSKPSWYETQIHYWPNDDGDSVVGPCPHSSPSLQPLCLLALRKWRLWLLSWLVMWVEECAAEWPQSFREWTLNTWDRPPCWQKQTTERSPRQFELNFYDRSPRLALSGKTPYKPISPVTWSSFLRL